MMTNAVQVFSYNKVEVEVDNKNLFGGENVCIEKEATQKLIVDIQVVNCEWEGGPG